MRKLEITDPDVMRIAIQQEIARSDESRYDHRLHSLLLVTGGQSCQEVAKLFGEDRRTVQRWVKRFETHGLEGVREGERSGRPTTLDAKQWAALGRDLRRDPEAFGLAATCGTAKCSPIICVSAITWRWACASASVSLGAHFAESDR